MRTDEYVEQLDELVEKCWNLPLSGGRCVVDGELIHEIVGNLRDSLPSELMQAKAIVADRNEILETAKQEAERMQKIAEEKAQAIVARDEIVKRAEAQAADIMASTTKQANDLVHETNVKVSAMVEAANKKANETINSGNAQASALLASASSESAKMLKEATAESEKLRANATAYADNAFKQLMDALRTSDMEVKRAHGEYKASQNR